jgi:hypothetical protein
MAECIICDGHINDLLSVGSSDNLVCGKCIREGRV